MIKSLLKRIPFLRAICSNIRNRLLFYKVVAYGRARFLRYSGTFSISEEWCLSELVMIYHVIEKGLTMPNRRLGFGKDMVMELISKIEAYERQFDTSSTRYKSAVGVLAEYLLEHDQVGFILDKEFDARLRVFLKNRMHIESTKQIDISRDDYYANLHSSFDRFSWSRRSIRNFYGSIDIDQIKKAVELANNAPSACNRQPTRVHLIASKDLVEKCMALQNGNRGFGHLVDKLLIITVDVRPFMLSEMNDSYINGGLFAMNLSYALHFNEVAHCMLNWSVLPETDCKLRKLLNLPPFESVIMYIACADVPDKFKYAVSCKKTSDENLKVYKK